MKAKDLDENLFPRRQLVKAYEDVGQEYERTIQDRGYQIWYPLVWFVKGKRPEYQVPGGNYIESVPPDKSLHDWKQSSTEAEWMISTFTVENEVVLDPFMGSGTTGIAALQLKRKFIGIEINEDTFNIAKSTIAEFLTARNQQLAQSDRL
jgi:hypothetical protein